MCSTTGSLTTNVVFHDTAFFSGEGLFEDAEYIVMVYSHYPRSTARGFLL